MPGAVYGTNIAIYVVMRRRLAIPVYNGRISPLFDSAGRFEIFLVVDNIIEGNDYIDIGDDSGMARVERLSDRGINLVICAAISRVLAEFIIRKNIDLIPGVCGNVHEVLDAYLGNNLRIDLFSMPGTGRMNRRRKGQCPHYRDIRNCGGKWRV
jgi:predicted Fe-Mo cluster-binding NifX family protein